MGHLKTSFLESKSTIYSSKSIFSCVSKYISILCCWELFVEFTLVTGVCYYTRLWSKSTRVLLYVTMKIKYRKSIICGLNSWITFENHKYYFFGGWVISRLWWTMNSNNRLVTTSLCSLQWKPWLELASNFLLE